MISASPSFRIIDHFPNHFFQLFPLQETSYEYIENERWLSKLFARVLNFISENLQPHVARGLLLAHVVFSSCSED
jgi:hypothetical protein